jgi:hypothetical protein
MVQAREEGNTHGTKELESTIDWKVVNRSLIEMGIDMVTTSMRNAAHAPSMRM